MHHFRHGNRAVIWLNLLLLFFLTLLPFVTNLKGAFRYEFFVTLLFGGVQILIGVGLILIWNYAFSHPHLLKRKISEDIHRQVIWRMLISPIFISVLAVLTFLIDVHLSSLAFLSIPLYYLSFPIIDRHETESMKNE